ncbi:MAG: hypothetical protein HQK66_14505 [Desulfamplus sp.]|nr:hypothetical protein [Desulfamplus sp.]
MRIDENYEIAAIDDIADACVQRKGFGGIRIDRGVAMVGKYNDFIYAKKIDGSYWLLDTKKDSDRADVRDCVSGPLTHDEIVSKLKDIGKSDNLEFQWIVK